MSRRRLNAAALAVAAAGAMALSDGAHAQSATLPNAFFIGGIRYYPFSVSFGAGTNATGASYSDSLGSVSGYADLTTQTVSVQGSTTDLGYGLIANAYLKYYFVLVSGTPGAVHVLINTATDASGAGSYFAEAEVDLTGYGAAVLARSHACNNVGYCNPFANHYQDGGSLPYLIQANHIYGITLSVDGHLTNPDSSFSALADPTITLDPAYTAPHGAKFVFSPNLPVVSAPEPASWALMLIGFAGLGAKVRAGRRTAAAAL